MYVYLQLQRLRSWRNEPSHWLEASYTCVLTHFHFTLELSIYCLKSKQYAHNVLITLWLTLFEKVCGTFSLIVGKFFIQIVSYLMVDCGCLGMSQVQKPILWSQELDYKCSLTCRAFSAFCDNIISPSLSHFEHDPFYNYSWTIESLKIGQALHSLSFGWKLVKSKYQTYKFELLSVN